jgi:hypothetical protein
MRSWRPLTPASLTHLPRRRAAAPDWPRSASSARNCRWANPRWSMAARCVVSLSGFVGQGGSRCSRPLDRVRSVWSRLCTSRRVGGRTGRCPSAPALHAVEAALFNNRIQPGKSKAQTLEVLRRERAQLQQLGSRRDGRRSGSLGRTGQVTEAGGSCTTALTRAILHPVADQPHDTDESTRSTIGHRS